MLKDIGRTIQTLMLNEFRLTHVSAIGKRFNKGNNWHFLASISNVRISRYLLRFSRILGLLQMVLIDWGRLKASQISV